MITERNVQNRFRVALAALIFIILFAALKAYFWPQPVVYFHVLAIVFPSLILMGVIGDARGYYRALTGKNLWF